VKREVANEDQEDSDGAADADAASPDIFALLACLVQRYLLTCLLPPSDRLDQYWERGSEEELIARGSL